MMMARRAAAAPPLLPLLVWHELSEIDRLQAERAELMRRVNLYPPHAHRRVILESRLRDLTMRLMRAETKIGATP